MDFRLRVNAKDGQPYAWKDFRPQGGKFEPMCSYRMFMKYKTKYLSFDDMRRIQKAKKKKKNESDDDESEEEFDEYEKLFTGNIYQFLDEHPGSEYSHLAELELEVIPKISLPEGKLCDVALLEVTETTVDKEVMYWREDYAKMALLMFYPFRTLGNLKLDGRFLKLFWRELCLYKEGKKYSFWTKGFEILQNIQDWFTIKKQMRRAKNPVCVCVLTWPPVGKALPLPRRDYTV